MSVIRSLPIEEGEEILITVRQYTLLYWWRFLLGGLLVVSGFFFLFWFVTHGLWGQIAVAAILILGWSLLLLTLNRWKKNLLVFTNQRVFIVTSNRLFDRSVSIITYDMLEHVSGTIQGVLGTIFRFGFLSLHTLGNTPIHFFPVKSPTRIQQTVHELILTYRKKYHKQGESVSHLARQMGSFSLKELEYLGGLIQHEVRRRRS